MVVIVPLGQIDRQAEQARKRRGREHVLLAPVRYNPGKCMPGVLKPAR